MPVYHAAEAGRDLRKFRFGGHTRCLLLWSLRLTHSLVCRLSGQRRQHNKKHPTTRKTQVPAPPPPPPPAPLTAPPTSPRGGVVLSQAENPHDCVQNHSKKGALTRNILRGGASRQLRSSPSLHRNKKPREINSKTRTPP